jgi:hypothetical protein
MHAIQTADVAQAVAWLDTVDPSIELPEIRLNAVTRGPWARDPMVPLEVERRAAAGNPVNTTERVSNAESS